MRVEETFGKTKDGRTDGRTSREDRQTESDTWREGAVFRFRIRPATSGFYEQFGAKGERPRNAAYPARCPNDESSETTVMKTSYTVNLSRLRSRRLRR